MLTFLISCNTPTSIDDLVLRLRSADIVSSQDGIVALIDGNFDRYLFRTIGLFTLKRENLKGLNMLGSTSFLIKGYSIGFVGDGKSLLATQSLYRNSLIEYHKSKNIKNITGNLLHVQKNGSIYNLYGHLYINSKTNPKVAAKGFIVGALRENGLDWKSVSLNSENIKLDDNGSLELNLNFSAKALTAVVNKFLNASN